LPGPSAGCATGRPFLDGLCAEARDLAMSVQSEIGKRQPALSVGDVCCPSPSFGRWSDDVVRLSLRYFDSQGMRGKARERAIGGRESKPRKVGFPVYDQPRTPNSAERYFRFCLFAFPRRSNRNPKIGPKYNQFRG